MPFFVPGEQTPKRTTEEQCEASRRLAVLYAQHGEDGFKEIASITGVIPTDNYFSRSKIEVDDVDTAAWETMFRLFLTACPSLVPSEALTAASYCGGISPGRYITPFEKCPGAGDPGKHAYAKLCDCLKEIFVQREAKDPDLKSKVPAFLQPSKGRFFQTQRDDRLAAFVKASLGASDAAYAVVQFTKNEVSDWMRSSSEIVGASYGNGDRVTPFIDGRWLDQGFYKPRWLQMRKLCLEVRRPGVRKTSDTVTSYAGRSYGGGTGSGNSSRRSARQCHLCLSPKCIGPTVLGTV